MPRFDMKWEISPQFFISAANFCAIVLGVLWGYASLTGDVQRDKQTITVLQGEIAKLQARDDSTIELIRQIQLGFGNRLVKLEADTTYIKDSVARIEQRQAGNR